MASEIEVGRNARGLRMGIAIALLLVAAAALFLTRGGRTVEESGTTLDSLHVAESSAPVSGECSSTTQYCERIAASADHSVCVSTTQLCERMAVRSNAGRQAGLAQVPQATQRGDVLVRSKQLGVDVVLPDSG